MTHFVYRTTNLLNGKQYIGKHSTDDINDGYLGSGVALRRAINKYGADNFKREIIKEFANSDEALAYEQELVNEAVVNDPNFYNMKLGGKGGNIIFTDAVKQKMRIAAAKRWKGKGPTSNTKWINDGKNSRIVPADSEIPDGWSRGHLHGRKDAVKPVEWTTAKTSWWNNGTINKLIKPGETAPDGFVKGRLIKWKSADGKFNKG